MYLVGTANYNTSVTVIRLTHGVTTKPNGVTQHSKGKEKPCVQKYPHGAEALQFEFMQLEICFQNGQLQGTAAPESIASCERICDQGATNFNTESRQNTKSRY